MKDRFINLFQTNRFNFFVICVVCFLIILPIFIYGVPFGYDMPHHYQCALTYLESLKTGELYPSWTLNRNLGYGALELRMYPPISHYVLVLFELLTNNWYLATCFTYLFWWILGSSGLYLFAREFVKPPAALFAAVLFALMPYRLSQLYLTFLYSELSAIAVLPFCFYFLTKIIKNGAGENQIFETDKKSFLSVDVLGLAVSYAVLILTHLPMTVIGSIALGIYFFAQVRWNFKSLQSTILRAVCSVAIALSATSFFWIKVIQEHFLMAKISVYDDVYAHFQYNFLLTALQSYNDVSFEVYSMISVVYDAMLFLTFFVVLPVGLLGLLSKKTYKNSLWRGVWITFIMTVFLTTVLSRPLWNNLPLLSEVQFPWRFLGIVSIFAPVIAAAGFTTLINWLQAEKRRPFALVIAGTILIGSFFAVNQSIRGAIYKDSVEIENYVKDAGQKEGFTFWWTIWARKDFVNRKVNKVSIDSRQTNILEWKPTERVFTVGEGKPSDVYVATFYHPNWQATVNEIQTEIRPADDGGIIISVPSQTAIIKLSFQDSPIVIQAQFFSKIVWLLLLCFGVFWYVRNCLISKNSNAQDNLINGKFYKYFYKIHEFSFTKYAWLFLVIFSIFTLLPMVVIGIYNGVDLSQHVQFADTFEKAIISGDFYPSWAANENLGYGSLGVRFYPPLTSFVFGLVDIALGDWHAATWITLLFFTLLGSLGVYLWAKEFIPPSKAIWAGVAFTLMPYHLHEIYNASLYAEFAGCCVITFSFLFITKICKNGNALDVLGLAVSYAVLILTHLPSTVFGSLLLCLYGMVLLFQTKNWLNLIKLSLAVGFGLLASSLYWVKMVTEMDWLRITKFSSIIEYFDYNQHFLFNLNFESLYFTLFAFLLLVLVLGSLFSLYFLRSIKIKREFVGVITIFFFSLFMTTPLSKPIWMSMPFLQQVQFPWRLLTISSISGSVLLAAGIESIWKLSDYSQNWKKAIHCYVALIFLCLSFIWVFIGIEYFKKVLPPKEFDSMVAEKSQSMGFEWFWTTKTKETVFDIKEKVIAEGREITISSWKPIERTFSVEAGSATKARIATLFYPHWRATVNNISVEPILADDGAMLIPIPSEKSTVKIWFQEPFQIKAAFYITAITWLIFVILMVVFLIIGFFKVFNNK